MSKKKSLIYNAILNTATTILNLIIFFRLPDKPKIVSVLLLISTMIYAYLAIAGWMNVIAKAFNKKKI